MAPRKSNAQRMPGHRTGKLSAGHSSTAKTAD
jgi:hypothetical protein